MGKALQCARSLGKCARPWGTRSPRLTGGVGKAQGNLQSWLCAALPHSHGPQGAPAPASLLLLPPLPGTLVRLWPGALAGGIALLACSSSSDRPPQLGACVPTHGVACSTPTTAGGGSPPSDAAAASDSGTEIVGEGGSCTGASEIFSAAAPSCVSCIAASCCANAASCPERSRPASRSRCASR